MKQSTKEVAAVAAEAVQASGDYLSEAFRDGPVDGEYDSVDVKAVADREAERRIRSVIETQYSDHVFHGEESGRADGRQDTESHDYRWVVDPLDGTNNFASGYPKFATAAAVLKDDEPIVAAIYEPLIDSLYLARKGQGATLNGEPLHAESPLSLAHGTVALVIGLSAVTDPPLAQQAEALELALRDRCKRVVPTWAPCVDWGLLARGSIEGLVCFHPGIYEQHAGSLLAAESGIDVVDTITEDGRYIGAPDPETTDRLCEVVDETI
jgi:myo-inositol-1(or 4)-monophosphatase